MGGAARPTQVLAMLLVVPFSTQSSSVLCRGTDHMVNTIEMSGTSKRGLITSDPVLLERTRSAFGKYRFTCMAKWWFHENGRLSYDIDQVDSSCCYTAHSSAFQSYARGGYWHSPVYPF